MADDTIPSAHLYQIAFAAEDPVPYLLKILKDSPTYVIDDLVISYIQEVEENPSCGGSLASALVRLYNSPNAPRDLRSDIDRELALQHFKVNHGPYEVKEYGPQNTYLLDSFLSGLSLKYGLATTSDMLVAIHDGLNARPGSDKAELLVIGSCIQLLLHGSLIVSEQAGSYQKPAKEIAQELRAHLVAGTVKDPNAIRVLELAISHAESGLKPEGDREDVWALLFPSKSQ